MVRSRERAGGSGSSAEPSTRLTSATWWPPSTCATPWTSTWSCWSWPTSRGRRSGSRASARPRTAWPWWRRRWATRRPGGQRPRDAPGRPSYTADTLAELRRAEPDAELFVILGATPPPGFPPGSAPRRWPARPRSWWSTGPDAEHGDPPSGWVPGRHPRAGDLQHRAAATASAAGRSIATCCPPGSPTASRPVASIVDPMTPEQPPQLVAATSPWGRCPEERALGTTRGGDPPPLAGAEPARLARPHPRSLPGRDPARIAPPPADAAPGRAGDGPSARRRVELPDGPRPPSRRRRDGEGGGGPVRSPGRDPGGRSGTARSQRRRSSLVASPAGQRPSRRRCRRRGGARCEGRRSGSGVAADGCPAQTAMWRRVAFGVAAGRARRRDPRARYDGLPSSSRRARTAPTAAPRSPRPTPATRRRSSRRPRPWRSSTTTRNMPNAVTFLSLSGPRRRLRHVRAARHRGARSPRSASTRSASPTRWSRSGPALARRPAGLPGRPPAQRRRRRGDRPRQRRLEPARGAGRRRCNIDNPDALDLGPAR